MATDFLKLNCKVLEQIKAEEGETSARYRTLVRYLECQNIYAKQREAGKSKNEAWQAAATHWNAWANNLLEKRKNLEENGKWYATKGKPGQWKGLNKATEQWLDEAHVKFQNVAFYLFDEELKHDFEKYDHKSKNTVFCKILSFVEFIFPSDAFFIKCRFFNSISFIRARFYGVAWFGKTLFHGDAHFDGTWFNADARFGKAQFDGSVTFEWTRFDGAAWFEEARFHDPAYFVLAEFKRPANFSAVCFYDTSDFSSICSQRSFSLYGAYFAEVPDFNEAHFHAPPVLDDIHVADQRRSCTFLLNRFLPQKWRIPCEKYMLPKYRLATRDILPLLSVRHVPEPEKNAKSISRNFRALGKMAHEARDWLNEMKFFAHEQRSRRFGEDCPFGPNAWRFWLGLFYDKLSDFGRSFARPVLAWVGLTLAFAALYAGLAVDGSAQAAMSHNKCAEKAGQWCVLDALYLSVRHGLVIGGLVRTGHMQEVICIMFGGNSSGLALVMIGQTLLSAVLWFFFFLAIRNHFRIR